MASIKYWLWLSTLPRVGNQMKLALLEHFGRDPEAIYYGEEAEYLLVEGMTRQTAGLLRNKSLETASQVLGDCERLGLRIITMQDGDYPGRLRSIYNPPILLYVQGRMPQFDEEVAIAMVGTRRPSAYGLEMSEKLAYQLAGLGAIVVSGLAMGGDAAAHTGALRAGGFTVGVIGGGHDIIYPRESRHLYEDLAVRGTIISEYPPGTEHRGGHFPVRNRIISGLSLATVVVEAPQQSGTLITAGLALEQNRDVFALPGQVGDPHCTGSNLLLRDGAGLVTGVWDILNHYVDRFPHKIRNVRMESPRRFSSIRPEPEPEKKEAEKAPALPVLDLSGDHGLTGDQICILKALQGRTVQVDDLIEETQIPTRQVLSALTMLEIDKYVTQESGKRFSLAVTLQ